jgi:peptide/nickel transport system ATP-binding protein
MQNAENYNHTNRFHIEISGRERSLVSIDNFHYIENGITILLGESGIGKSLIARAIYGLLDPMILDVSINKQPLTNYLKTVYSRQVRNNGFFVFQEPSSHLNPLLQLKEQINEGDLAAYEDRMENISRLWQETPPQKITELLNLYPKPYRPSGGEKQRILIAMAFKKIDIWQKTDRNSESTLFIFDEPTGSLDNFYRNIFIKELFEKYRRAPFTILLITHDYSLISEIQEKHSDLTAHIQYKELSRRNGQLQAIDFASSGYLSWLQHPPRHNQPGKRLLTLSNHMRVFGHALRVSKDQEGTQPCPVAIHAHEMVYLKAKSGVGKTTLAKVVMGLIPADTFLLYIGKEKLTARTPPAVWKKKLWAKRIGMVFQHADESLNLNASVLSTFKGLPIKIEKMRLINELRHLIGPQIDQAFLTKKVAYLSGGQKQKLNLLRTFLTDPDILILDEPLNGLDFDSIKKIMAYLMDKQTQGKGILLISHNEEIFDHFIPASSTYYLHAEQHRGKK